MASLLEEVTRVVKHSAKRYLLSPPPPNSTYPTDFSDDVIHTIRYVQPFTMTSPERIAALINAVEYIVRSKIPGDIVECGVWKGGSMMAVAQTLVRLEQRDKQLYMFDTFDGMSLPTQHDVSLFGENAEDLLEQRSKDEQDVVWAFSPLNRVQENLSRTGYSNENMHYIQGKVEDTIPWQAPPSISLLRLDTDWYVSTRHELIHLFPRIAPGGVLIIDDYGHWQGARKAVDEYLEANHIKLLLNRIDYTGRIGIKWQ